MFLGDKIYLEWTVDFTIKGDNSVNDSQIQPNLLDFNVDYLLRAGRFEWIITHFIV